MAALRDAACAMSVSKRSMMIIVSRRNFMEDQQSKHRANDLGLILNRIYLVK